MLSTKYIVYNIITNMSGNTTKFKMAEFEDLEYALTFVSAWFDKYYNEESLELSIERIEGIEGECEE